MRSMGGRFLARGFLCFIISLLTIVLSGCANREIKSLGDAHIANLNVELNSLYKKYELEFNAVQGRIAARESALAQNSQLDWNNYMSSVLQSAADVENLHKIAGRGDIISEFINYARSLPVDPSASLFQSWFISKYENLKLDDSAVHREFLAISDSAGKDSYGGSAWVSRLFSVSEKRGKVMGSAAQLEALYGIVQSYYIDVNQIRREEAESAARQQRAILSALAVYNQYSYQQQLINTINKPRTCTKMGNSVTCY